MTKSEKSKFSELEQLTFEEAYKRLERIANYLENSEISIESAIDAFEEGQFLYKLCQKKLEQAELKLKHLEEIVPKEE
ncbi:MAG: exodeoxyribonuclease VII small subunit [bacterium]|nr:exodeoxyribonuclease VII small subunit [bacterium]